MQVSDLKLKACAVLTVLMTLGQCVSVAIRVQLLYTVNSIMESGKVCLWCWLQTHLPVFHWIFLHNYHLVSLNKADVCYRAFQMSFNPIHDATQHLFRCVWPYHMKRELFQFYTQHSSVTLEELWQVWENSSDDVISVWADKRRYWVIILVSVRSNIIGAQLILGIEIRICWPLLFVICHFSNL